MRDVTKVLIGFGSIWGLFAFGATVYASFTIDSNDTAPEVAAMILYGFTILPSCIFAIWFAKLAAVWLMALTPITALGLIYQISEQAIRTGDYEDLLKLICVSLLAAMIPGVRPSSA